jgi:hypothetical protein
MDAKEFNSLSDNDKKIAYLNKSKEVYNLSQSLCKAFKEYSNMREEVPSFGKIHFDITKDENINIETAPVKPPFWWNLLPPDRTGT